MHSLLSFLSNLPLVIDKKIMTFFFLQWHYFKCFLFITMVDIHSNYYEAVLFLKRL